MKTSRGGGATALGSVSTSGDGTPTGLNLRQTATATVPAEAARVVVVTSVGFTYDESGVDQGLTGADRADVVRALEAAGIGSEGVHFDTELDSEVVEIDVALDQLASRGPEIAAAVEDVLGSAERSGVRFDVVDCERALAPLRQEAFAKAEAQARAWAATTSLSLGPIVALTEDSLAADRPDFDGSQGDERCGSPQSGFYGRGPSLDPFDGPPEVRLTIGVTMTYGLGETPTSTGLSAMGSGTATVEPDEAYVVVVVGGDEYEEEEPSEEDLLSAGERDELYRKLVAARFARDDIKVELGPYGEIVVQVDTGLDELEEDGKKIQDAVEDVLGSGYGGVRFSHSECADVVAGARKEAVADARERAAAMAEATGVTLGALHTVADVPAFGAVDPCDESLAAMIASDYGPPLAGFDAHPEFKVVGTVQLGFALAP